jgi:hypothetical protein
MGEFYENINLYGLTKGEAESAIRAVMAEQHFREVDPASLGDRPPSLVGDPQNTIRLLVSPKHQKWVTIFHSQIEAEWLREALARESKQPLLYLNLHDGDVLYYTFYNDGRIVDEFCSIPDYFAASPEEVEQGVEGHPDRLLPVLRNEGDVAKLQSIMHPPDEMVAADGLGMLSDLSNLLELGDTEDSYHYIASGGRLGEFAGYSHLAFTKGTQSLVWDGLLILVILLLILAVSRLALHLKRLLDRTVPR